MARQQDLHEKIFLSCNQNKNFCNQTYLNAINAAMLEVNINHRIFKITISHSGSFFFSSVNIRIPIPITETLCQRGVNLSQNMKSAADW